MNETSATRACLGPTYSMIYTRRGLVSSRELRNAPFSLGVSWEWGSGWAIFLSERFSFPLPIQL